MNGASLLPPVEEAAIDEFGLIRRFFDWPGQTASGANGVVALGIGDDCALLAAAPGEVLAITTDTLIAGRHFPAATGAFDIGWKALAVSLSDLGAMGARPLAFLLALSLPAADAAWLEAFAAGLRELAQKHGLGLIGGDTTRGALSITITALGSVPVSSALRRGGAQPGDCVCVSGTLGDAALGLRLALGEATAPQADAAILIERLNRPTPRIEAGLALRGLASAAIDLSDGLASDLGHILAASGVGAVIEPALLPMSPAFSRVAAVAERMALQAAGGDDYELCICVPQDRLQEALAAVPLTVVGKITAEPGLRWHDPSGAERVSTLRGYRHFE